MRDDPVSVIAAMMYAMGVTRFTITDEQLVAMPRYTVSIFRRNSTSETIIMVEPVQPQIQEPQGPPATVRAHSTRMDQPKEIEA